MCVKYFSPDHACARVCRPFLLVVAIQMHDPGLVIICNETKFRLFETEIEEFDLWIQF